MKELINLISRKEKGVCVTIVQGGKMKSFDDKEKAQVRLRKVISTAKKMLETEHGNETAERVVKELNTQFFNLDFGNARETLVIYANQDYGKSVWLPFEEKERLTIRNSFDLQPLHDAMNKERDYWVLALSKNKTRLLRGKNEVLEEVTDKNFPAAYEEQFQYEKPRYPLSHNSGTFSPRDEKLVMERTDAFYRHIDHLLKPYLKREDLPVIILGAEANVGDFIKTSSIDDNIIARLKGNYDHHSAGQIAAKVWPVARQEIMPVVV